MVESVTLHYGWIKPEVQHSPTTWGGYLNDMMDAVDGLIYAGQQAIVPIGSVTMFVGDTPPANWLWCLGQVYQITDIPLLAPLLKNRFPGGDGTTTMAVPNFGGHGPMGYDGGGWAMGASGGEINHTLGWGEMPAHNHSASQDAHVHYAWQDAHAHTVGNTQAHSHNIVTGNHSHGIHTGNHSHGIPYDLVNPSAGGLTNGGASFGLAGGQRTDSAGDLGGYTDTAGNLGGYTDTQALAVGNTDTRQPGTYTDNRQPGTYTANAGSGAAHNNMQPYLIIGFIVRYQ